jgi:hypothetical protein
VKTIWKFPLEVTDEQTVALKVGANIIGVQLQYGKLCMWAVVDPHEPEYFATVRVVGTGNPFPDADQCHPIGIVQQGSFVWHVFLRKA